MIPLSALGGGPRPPGGGSGPMGGGGGAGGGMIPLGALGGGMGGPMMSPPGMGGPPMGPPGMAPPSMAPPSMAPPGAGGGAPQMGGFQGMPGMSAVPPPSFGEAAKQEAPGDTLAEVGKSAHEYLDPLMPITIPSGGEDARPVPKQVQCLEDGTDLFKMFDVDMHRFDARAVKRAYHRMVQFVHPDKLGREASAADRARFTKLKQAYTVIMDDQLRAIYRQHCYGIAGSGGIPAQGHNTALSKALELGRDLRKMGEERAIVLHKASETGWAVQQKDQDGRTMRGDARRTAHQFNLFGDISSSDDDAELEKERRGMTAQQILEKSPKYADKFLERVRPILLDPKVSKSAAGGAFTMLEEPKLLDYLNENPKTVQRHLRKTRTAVKQMHWAMTSLLQHKDSPWRGLEVRASLVEHGAVKLLELVKAGIAVGKFNAVHEEEFGKLVDNLHRLYMDIFERRGQELLRGAISTERKVIHILPESGGRLPDGTKVILQELKSRADLNGKGGVISGWDFSLQRYTVELDKEDAKNPDKLMPANPDLMAVDDVDDADDDDEEETALQLAIPKKLMVMPKNVYVDLEVQRKRMDGLVKDWCAWMRRPRSVSATQDAEAVAAALGPPLESMAGYLQEASSALSAGAAGGRDGADLIAMECREALQGARNLAAKLLGEEAEEPPAPPPMNEPPPAIVPFKAQDDEVSRVLKEAAEVAAAGIEIKKRSRSRKKKSRSRSRRRRRRRSSSS